MNMQIITDPTKKATEYTISDALMPHPIVSKAFSFASKCFEGLTRGSSFVEKKPEISHSVQVAQVLERTVEYDPNLVAAALVHDTVEEKKTTIDELRAALNDDIAHTTDEVSLDTNIKGKLRRDMQLAALDSMSLNGRRVKVADRAVNLLNLAFDPPEHWRLENKINYFLSSKRLFERAEIPDPKLKAFASEALQLAERVILVGVRDRMKERGENAKFNVEGDISEIVARAKLDLDIMPHLYDDKGMPVQIHDNLDELYEDGTRAHKEIGMVVRHISDMYGFTAVVPSLKSRERAEEVVKTRMQDDPRYLKDIARVALVCDTMQEVDYALHMLSHSYPNAIVYDRMANPPPTGYRDKMLVVRSDRSHFCEIQVHLKSYWDAKKYRGDEIYNEIRKLGVANELTPAEKKARRALYAESRELYNKAGEPHGFIMQKEVARCEPYVYVPATKSGSMETKAGAMPLVALT